MSWPLRLRRAVSCPATTDFQMDNHARESVEFAGPESRRYHARQSVLRLIGESALLSESFRRSRPSPKPQQVDSVTEELRRQLLADCSPEELEKVRDYFGYWEAKIRATSERRREESSRHDSLRDAGSLLAEARIRMTRYLEARPEVDDADSDSAVAAILDELARSDEESGYP